MIKQVPAQALKAGMYIHDLNCDWMSHPFVRTKFRLEGDKQIETILEAGIHEVYIDTSKGLDVPDAPTAEEVREQAIEEVRAIASSAPPPIPRVDLAAEMAEENHRRNGDHQAEARPDRREGLTGRLLALLRPFVEDDGTRDADQQADRHPVMDRIG